MGSGIGLGIHPSTEMPPLKWPTTTSSFLTFLCVFRWVFNLNQLSFEPIQVFLFSPDVGENCIVVIKHQLHLDADIANQWEDQKNDERKEHR
jgi:hypothetical protein